MPPNIPLLWCGLLIAVAMMMIPHYSLRNTLVFMVMSLFGVLVIIFLMLLFFSLISDGIAYIVSLYKELSFRLY